MKHEDVSKSAPTSSWQGNAKDYKNLDKNIVVSLLGELKDCLNQNVGLETLLDDYRSSLHFHSTAGRFYYGDGPQRIFSNEANFRSQVIDDKVNLLDLPVE